jgi:hypothetical protein
MNVAITNNCDDNTVVTLNCSCNMYVAPVINRCVPSLATAASHVFGTPAHKALNAITIATQEAIANTDAILIFIMDGINVENKCIATKPITINLPDGRKVQSTHMCDFVIPGLPTPLVGHIVPNLAVASLLAFAHYARLGVKYCSTTRNVILFIMGRLYYMDLSIRRRTFGRYP